MATLRNDKLFIFDGLQIGRLTVGDVVYNVRNHELYVETPPTYLTHGRLREVFCSCGGRKLVSERALSTGRIQSCGCLRREILEKARAKKQEFDKIRAERKQVNKAICKEQRILNILQLVDENSRDQKAIEECGTRLRELFARKQALKRKLRPEQIASDNRQEQWKLDRHNAYRETILGLPPQELWEYKAQKLFGR